jgi:hypothetical protein
MVFVNASSDLLCWEQCVYIDAELIRFGMETYVFAFQDIQKLTESAGNAQPDLNLTPINQLVYAMQDQFLILTLLHVSLLGNVLQIPRLLFKTEFLNVNAIQIINQMELPVYTVHLQLLGTRQA